jgi:hypothetical protein
MSTVLRAGMSGSSNREAAMRTRVELARVVSKVPRTSASFGIFIVAVHCGDLFLPRLGQGIAEYDLAEEPTTDVKSEFGAMNTALETDHVLSCSPRNACVTRTDGVRGRASHAWWTPRITYEMGQHVLRSRRNLTLALIWLSKAQRAGRVHLL